MHSQKYIEMLDKTIDDTMLKQIKETHFELEQKLEVLFENRKHAKCRMEEKHGHMYRGGAMADIHKDAEAMKPAY